MANLNNSKIDDPLRDFLMWYLSKPTAFALSEHCCEVYDNESVLTHVLYRNPPFQAELVILKPNRPAWPGQHRHPNVDSFEVAMFNCVDFIKNGQTQNGPELVLNTGGHRSLCVRLLPTDYHSTPALRPGASLLSVQHWQNDVQPTSVGLDWIGEPVAAGHAEQWSRHGNSATPTTITN